MIDEKLLSLCALLAKQGKKPNVGLLKSRVKSSFSLPEVIAAVQYWKANPMMEGIEPASQPKVIESKKEKNNEDTVVVLQQRVTTLEKQVSQLQSQIQKLIDMKP